MLVVCYVICMVFVCISARLEVVHVVAVIGAGLSAVDVDLTFRLSIYLSISLSLSLSIYIYIERERETCVYIYIYIIFGWHYFFFFFFFYLLGEPPKWAQVFQRPSRGSLRLKHLRRDRVLCNKETLHLSPTTSGQGKWAPVRAMSWLKFPLPRQGFAQTWPAKQLTSLPHHGLPMPLPAMTTPTSATCLLRPHLFRVLSVVSRITHICYITRHLWRKQLLDR